MTTCRLCPQNHALESFVTEVTAKCDVCGDTVKPGTRMHGCRQCNWDACSGCLRPRESPGRKRKRGHAMWGLRGLQNLGNTCYMSAAIQCLSHTMPLTRYFLKRRHALRVRSGGTTSVAKAYMSLIMQLWSGGFGSDVRPSTFRSELVRHAPRFLGREQHDCQELIACLLDGIHEELNDPSTAIMTTTRRDSASERRRSVDFDGEFDFEFQDRLFDDDDDDDRRNDGTNSDDASAARRAWQRHLRMNQSVVVDLFHGQYRSSLRCTQCERVSETFDPFMYLTLPLPQRAVAPKFPLLVVCGPGADDDDENDDMLRARAPRLYFLSPDELSASAAPSAARGDVLAIDVKRWVCRKLLARRATLRPRDVTLVALKQHRCCRGELRGTLRVDAEMLSANSVRSAEKLLCAYALPLSTAAKTTTTTDRLDFSRPFASRLSKMSARAPLAIKLLHRFGPARDGPLVGYPVLLGLLAPITRAALYDAVDSRLAYLYRVDDDERPPPFELLLADESGGLVAGHPPLPRDDKPFRGRTSLTLVVLWSPSAKQRVYGSLCVVRRDASAIDVAMPKWLEPCGRATTGEACPKGHPLLAFRSAICVTCDVCRRVVSAGKRMRGCRVCNWDACATCCARTSNGGGEEGEDATTKGRRRSRRSPKRARVPDASTTLYDCFRLWSSVERLGAKNMWYCSRCKRQVEARKELRLTRLPRILVVQLKRFRYSKTLRKRVNTAVRLELDDLDLSPFAVGGGDDDNKSASSPFASSSSARYRLVAVANHFGGVHGGHYTACAFNDRARKWYAFDDTSVVETDPASFVCSSSPYVLFYERRDGGEGGDGFV